MKRIGTDGAAVLGLTPSTADSNRLYSILLDARASTVTENMYDVTEKLLGNEKENAKLALDQLWKLKKNMHAQSDTATIDLLIKFYQDKLDILRNKEEHIKKVSKDSRTLLEEKRKKDSEIASVNQQIQEATEEISRLSEQLHKAKVKEQELILIEEQLKKELAGNENEIINGLYEIILAHQPVIEPDEEPSSPEPQGISSTSAPQAEIAEAPADPLDEETAQIESVHALYRQLESPQSSIFPKSVVKTTRGLVIGEYYYDPQALKNKRHYVFNSIFFMEQLAVGVQNLRQRFDPAGHTEMMQMIEDARQRITGSTNLHFEISTNEIVNGKSLQDLYRCAREKDFTEVVSFCRRLHAKISALGNNYKAMLREQIARYAQE